MPASAPPAGDLEREQAYLDHARAELARMRTSAEQLDASRASDAISGEVLSRVLARRIASLQDDPRTTLFFGRIDLEPDDGPAEQFHIGRRHVSDEAGDPVVVDWRAPISTAFYRASPVDRMDVVLRRRFGVDRGRLTALEDEHLVPAAGVTCCRHRSPGLAPRCRDRAPPHRPDARHRLDDPARAGRDRARRAHRQHLRAGRARHRQDRGRAAPSGVAALLLPRAARPLGRARHRPQPRVPRPHRGGASLARRGAGRARHHRVAPRPRPGPGHGHLGGGDPQGRRPARRRAAPGHVEPRPACDGGARGAARGAQVARAGIRRAGDPRRARRAGRALLGRSRPAAAASRPPPAARDGARGRLPRRPRAGRRREVGRGQEVRLVRVAGPRPAGGAAPPVVRRRCPARCGR